MDRSRAAHERQTDAELVRLARRDSAAFRTLYERHAPVMERWLFAQVCDITTTRELLAETWATAWYASVRFRGEDDRAGAAWLYGIARELVLQYERRHRVDMRARKRLRMRGIRSDDGELDDVARRVDAEKLSPGVRLAFQELTFEQQQAIGYRVIDGLTYEEMANHLGISQTTARVRVFRALEMLRSLLKGALL